MATDTQAPVELTAKAQMTTAAPSPTPASPRRAKRSLLYRVREYLHDSPRIFHFLQSVRLIAMVGPWRGLLVKYHQKFNRNAPLEVSSRTLFANVDVAEAARQIDRDGCAFGFTLPDEYVDRLLERCGTPGRSFGLRDPHRHWDVAKEIAYDPLLVEVARQYLGAEPIVFRSDIWTTQPGYGDGHAERFHFDVADYRSVTVFFYLTDVDAMSYPHFVIRGTHRPKTFRQCVRLYMTDAEAQREFGDRILRIEGPRGTGFWEEQTAFHKAGVSEKYRGILCVIYTLRRRPKHD